MRKGMKIFVLTTMLLIPNMVLAQKTVCRNDNGYEAIVLVDKDNIKLNEQSFIAIDSESSVEQVYYSTDNEILTVSPEGIIKAKKAGNAKIKTTILFDSENKCTTELSVNVLSNDATLKKLTTKEYDLTNVFNSQKYEYEIKLPYKNDEINIEAETNDSTAKITGVGKQYLNEGSNKLEIVVTAADNTTTTYKLNVTREKGNSDSSLKSLVVEGFKLTPQFSPTTTHYTLDLDENTDNITITGTPNNELSQIKGGGNVQVVSGSSSYFVTVTAEDGSTTKYEVEVNKKKGLSKLNSLKITGFNFEPQFDSDIFTYSLEIPSNISELNIKAVGDENDIIEITGNENLQEGENNILIKVAGQDKTTNTYKIVVNKISKEEEEKRINALTLTKVLLGIFIVSIIVMIILIGIFVKRNYHKKPKLKTNYKKIIKKKGQNKGKTSK